MPLLISTFNLLYGVQLIINISANLNGGTSDIRKR